MNQERIKREGRKERKRLKRERSWLLSKERQESWEGLANTKTCTALKGDGEKKGTIERGGD